MVMTRAKILVGGFLPTTTIDYPEHLSAVVFCKGCGWKCRYCHNPDLINSDNTFDTMDWDNILKTLEKRKNLIDAVVFSGGEPTLQKHIISAIEDVKKMGYLVGLHTNGAFPEKLEAVLPHVDWVGMDIKTIKKEYPSITGVDNSGEKAYESLDILLKSGVNYEIRTTYHKELISEENLRELAEVLSLKGVKKYVLQVCKTGRCLDGSLGKNEDLKIPDFSHMFETFEVRGV